MKKVLIILCISMFLLIGCGKKEKTIDLECDMGNTTIVLSVENGKIIEYVDKIKGDISKEEIETLNNSYLNNITNNKDAITKLREVIASNGGNCKDSK